MRIELRPDLQAPEGEAVGLADGEVLAYVGRIPHIGGRPYRQADIAPYLAVAVSEAATLVWGGEWTLDLSRVTRLNRRTVTKDRIEKYGLPSWVLALVGRAAAHPHPRALGYIMLGFAELNDHGPYTVSPTTARTEREGRERLSFNAWNAMKQASEMIFAARDERHKHHLPTGREDTDS
ncbi:hypothetical protein B2G69_07750 [Methylorubrum zatmanii]|nr:hypothetical protein [Methylorubrum zatmanii]ARO54049.1 hypothetical protein B2G69_07750 [Methylorubrum zatmanii]